jgi:hypothetical protein
MRRRLELREPLDDGHFLDLKKWQMKTSPWLFHNIGSVAARELRAHLNPATRPPGTSIAEVLSPSLKAYIGFQSEKGPSRGGSRISWRRRSRSSPYAPSS